MMISAQVVIFILSIILLSLGLIIEELNSVFGHAQSSLVPDFSAQTA